MEYSETEKQMLREILPGIATQLRGSLANIHAALGRLAPEQARDASADTDRSAAILCQSYYRILRVVNNLSDAPMLAEEKPLDTENVELVRFLDSLCCQGEALAQLMELRLTFTCPERAHTVAVNREYLARLFWNLVSNAMKFTPRGGTVDVCLRSGQGCVLLSVKDSGSGIPQLKTVGTLSLDQLREIAEIKMPDLNANDIEAAMEIVAGTARSMGVRIEGREMKKVYVPSKKLAAALAGREE